MVSNFQTAMLKAKQLYQSEFGQEKRSHSRDTNRSVLIERIRSLYKLRVEGVKVRGEARGSSDLQARQAIENLSILK